MRKILLWLLASAAIMLALPWLVVTFIKGDASKITSLLNEYALDGWRLVSAYVNELGHNSSSSGIGEFSTGSNSTIDQHILILERFVKIN